MAGLISRCERSRLYRWECRRMLAASAGGHTNPGHTFCMDLEAGGWPLTPVSLTGTVMWDTPPASMPGHGHLVPPGHASRQGPPAHKWSRSWWSVHATLLYASLLAHTHSTPPSRSPVSRETLSETFALLTTYLARSAPPRPRQPPRPSLPSPHASLLRLLLYV